ncbi:hypothetical protein ACHAW6_003424 [Cyclotella cf. meneghiniana]
MSEKEFPAALNYTVVCGFVLLILLTYVYPSKKGKGKSGLTPKQLELVQSSWEKVEPIADTAADIFYTKMFETEPSFRALFPEDMSKQKKALMKMLGLAVKGITDLDELVPEVQDLGRRHAKYYKVTVPMYQTVGACLLYTLEKGLGDTWTPEHKEAWALTYNILADIMIATHNE